MARSKSANSAYAAHGMTGARSCLAGSRTSIGRLSNPNPNSYSGQRRLHFRLDLVLIWSISSVMRNVDRGEPGFALPRRAFAEASLDCTPAKPVPWARLDDFVSGTAQLFPQLVDQVTAATLDEVPDALAAVERAADDGRWAVGFVSYEAAAGLSPDLPVAELHADGTGRADLPLVWFGLSDEPPADAELVRAEGSYSTGHWRNAWEKSEYANAFAEVKDAIADGETYQCNLTTSVSTTFAGDAEALYADLALAQRGRYSTYIDLGSAAIASASPELFFEWSGDQLRTRPMKGTARRGNTPEEDDFQRRRLLGSAKERAENIIVVDLLRNDLGRIARPGTVSVPALLTPERYETVWQLTSDVTARLVPDAGFVDILRALFPCGSVTGAPKIATMDLIRRIERRRRGVYCGCIGTLAPPGHPVRAKFNVAIRTVHIDRSAGRCDYGVGGGITWDSKCEDEFDELSTKCAILPNRR